jgi:trigger factor
VKLSVERKPQSLVVLDITADEDEFAQGLDQAFKKVGRDVQIPGFRKGKAPRALMEKYYGREYFLREAADQVMDRLYRDAIKQEDITPVGEPEVEIVELEPVQFVVTIPVYPTATLGDYSSVRVEPIDAATTEDDVQEVIDRLQRTQSPWVDVTEDRHPEDGEQVTVDYEVHEGDEEFQPPVKDALFILGETNLLSQLSEKLKEMKVGETDSFELVFEEDDETADPSIRGKALRYDVTLKTLKKRDLVEIDDEFAKKVAGVDSVAELRTRIFEDVHQGKTSDARNSVMNDIIEQIAEVSELELPHVMIHEEAHHRVHQLQQEMAQSGTPFDAYLRMQGKTEEDIAHDMEPEAAIRLRNSMLMREVAKAENIEVSDEEIDAEIAKMIGGNPDDTSDEAVAQRERMQSIYGSDYFRNALRTELFDRKLTDRLVEIATEGRGAVLNAWTAPELPATGDATETSGEEEAETASAEATEPDEAASAPKSNGSKKELGPAESEGTAWVAGDGEDNAPEGFPIKGNASSRIYHTEESPSYGRTIAEVYFATPEDAEAAGYRLPKSMQHAGEAVADAVANLAKEATSDDE